MYTGIVTGTFPVKTMTRRADAATFSLELDAKHVEGLETGASVSLAGVCMTVTKIQGHEVFFDASIETLNRTTLGQLEEGVKVNVERSAKAGAEVGGHPISGHIDGMAAIVGVERPGDNCVIAVKLPQDYVKYAFNKGFIALDGCSLTISEMDKATGEFKVYLIPETLRLTTFDQLQVGDRLNFEIDRQTQIIVDTIRDAMAGAMSAIKAEV